MRAPAPVGGLGGGATAILFSAIIKVMSKGA